MQPFIKRLIRFLGFVAGMGVLTYGLNTYLFHTVICTIPPQYTTLLLGHSHVRVSLDPAVVQHSIHATHGAQPYFLSYVKLQYLLQHNPHIKTVVLGFSPHDFSDYQDEKLLRQPWMDTFFDQFIPILPLSDLLWARVNRPRFVLSWVRHVLLPNPSYMRLMRQHAPLPPTAFPFFGRFSTYHEPRLPRLLQRFNLAKYPQRISGVTKRQYYVNGTLRRISETQVESFKRIMALCRSHGITVYLYTPPLYPWYRHTVPQRFQDTYRRLQAQYEAFEYVHVINLSALELPADHFWDVEHVNVKGMAIASRIVQGILTAGPKRLSESTTSASLQHLSVP